MAVFIHKKIMSKALPDKEFHLTITATLCHM